MYHEVKRGGDDIMQEKLLRIRKAHLESQSVLAKLIGVDLRTYQNKEAGITQFKSNEMFAIASHYGMKIDDIFMPTNFMNHEVY